MRKTIVPDELYRQARIRAIGKGISFKALVVAALEEELGLAHSKENQKPYFARRELAPEFNALSKSGAFSPTKGNRDITEITFENRDREVS